MSRSNIYFSEYYEIDHELLEKNGFLDVSLICDNPAFVDPFLIFANPKYRDLHNFIISYLEFLRDDALENKFLARGQFEHYYKFSEVKQVWLGYSIEGNSGLGLGRNFADSLFESLHNIFKNFGEEKITESAHIEKLCLLEDGVGVDKISDFTINLIKSYLLLKTQEFAVENINKKFLKEFAVEKVYFNPKTKMWEGGKFILPVHIFGSKEDFVALVPNDILAKDDTWISRNDFLRSNQSIFSVISNDELCEKMNRFFEENLFTKINKNKKSEKDYSLKSRLHAFKKTAEEYPELLDYYIKQKEDSRGDAIKSHTVKPEEINYFERAGYIKEFFLEKKYDSVKSYQDCLERIKFYKQVIESNSKNLNLQGKKFQEKQLQLLFKMTTYNSLFNYDAEVNNGRGPIDFVISMGSQDKTGLEFKLASNSKLKQNIQNQTDVYKTDSNLKYIIKVIFYFSDMELERINNILKDIEINSVNENIILIDCREKDSASNVK